MSREAWALLRMVALIIVVVSSCWWALAALGHHSVWQVHW